MYESQKRANKKWLAENYEQIAIRLPKGSREKMKKWAEQAGLSLAAFILTACEEKHEKLSKNMV